MRLNYYDEDDDEMIDYEDEIDFNDIEDEIDCDDFENLEDFLDEYDGCMPDGSDAEDYWEEW